MPYEPGDAHSFTHKANTDRRDRQWRAVYESSRARGDDEGTAIAKASGVVKKDVAKWKAKRRAQMRKSAMELVVGGFEKEAGFRGALRQVENYVDQRGVRGILFPKPSVVRPAVEKVTGNMARGIRSAEKRMGTPRYKNYMEALKTRLQASKAKGEVLMKAMEPKAEAMAAAQGHRTGGPSRFREALVGRWRRAIGSEQINKSVDRLQGAVDRAPHVKAMVPKNDVEGLRGVGQAVKDFGRHRDLGVLRSDLNATNGGTSKSSLGFEIARQKQKARSANAAYQRLSERGRTR